MRAHGITGIHAGGQMTDDILDRLAKLDFVTALDLSSSGRVTDEGMRHIGKMQRLESLNLSGCDITDSGLGALSQLHSPRILSVPPSRHFGRRPREPCILRPDRAHRPAGLHRR